MAQYNSISKEYEKGMMELPLRVKIIDPMVLTLLGGKGGKDVEGKKVLDLACGHGFPAFNIKDMGASKVVGVDISSSMIEMAKESAKKGNYSNLDFIVHDVLTLPKIGDFAIYLLHYAKNEEELIQMCKSIKINLAPGGRFVGIVQAYQTKDLRHMEKQGLFYSALSDPKDGDPFTLTIKDKEGATIVTLNCHYMEPATTERAFKAAGFTHFEWIRPFLPENATIQDKEFLKETLDNPPNMGIIAW